MHMVGLAAWTAFGLGPSGLLVILTQELPVRLVVLVGVLLKIDVLDGKLARLLDLLVRPLDFASFESRLTFGGSFGGAGVGVPLEHGVRSTEGHLLGEVWNGLLGEVYSRALHARVVAFSLFEGSARVHLVVGGVPVLFTFKLSPDSSLPYWGRLSWHRHHRVLLSDQRLLDWGDDSSSNGRSYPFGYASGVYGGRSSVTFGNI